MVAGAVAKERYMKERLRGFLGFLGLVEDDYGDFGPNSSPRPFSEPNDEYEPEWAPNSPPAPRNFPTQSQNSTSFRSPAAAPPPRRTTSISVLDGVNGPTRVRAMANPNATRPGPSFSPERDVAVVSPGTYDESRRITDHLRSNRAVVLTTLDADSNLARRLVDFTAGTAYALNAKIEMLVRGVYLVSPQGMNVGSEVKESLRATHFRSADHA